VKSAVHRSAWQSTPPAPITVPLLAAGAELEAGGGEIILGFSSAEGGGDRNLATSSASSSSLTFALLLSLPFPFGSPLDCAFLSMRRGKLRGGG
jgi:hypothetical protein